MRAQASILQVARQQGHAPAAPDHPQGQAVIVLARGLETGGRMQNLDHHAVPARMTSPGAPDLGLAAVGRDGARQFLADLAVREPSVMGEAAHGKMPERKDKPRLWSRCRMGHDQSFPGGAGVRTRRPLQKHLRMAQLKGGSVGTKPK